MLTWTESPEALSADIELKDFSSAFACMTEIALAAEKLDHHPEWTNVYNRISFRLYTHAAGNTVTDKDRALQKAIDRICAKYRPG